MAAITAEMVAAAEAEVAEAVRVRGEAEAALMEAPNSTLKAQELAGALKRVAQARANAKELAEERERQVAAERQAATREELEKAAGKEIAAAGKELKAARGRLEDAAEAAQRALVELMVQAEGYNEVVDRHAAVLSGCGLDAAGATGAGATFAGWVVKVRGAEYETAASGAVLAQVAYRVAEARLPYPSYLTGLFQYNCGRLEPEHRGDGLLSGLSAPARAEYPELPRLRVAS